jgi:hypothetical protein
MALFIIDVDVSVNSLKNLIAIVFHVKLNFNNFDIFIHYMYYSVSGHPNIKCSIYSPCSQLEQCFVTSLSNLLLYPIYLHHRYNLTDYVGV